MAAHTPGPWRTEAEDSAICAGPMTLARVYWDDGRGEAEDRANARLIAAAPDLLEAAHAALAQMTGGYPGDPLTESWFPHTGTVHALARAIYRAEGREVTSHVAS